MLESKKAKLAVQVVYPRKLTTKKCKTTWQNTKSANALNEEAECVRVSASCECGRVNFTLVGHYL